MKRMICFISGQLLPNFIPVNEPKTRPDVLHAIYTPKNQTMTRNWKCLKETIKNKFPALQFEEIEIENEYDGAAIKEKCEGLLRDNPTEEWCLNTTGGTKMMSSPAIEVFGNALRPVYYVETPKGRTLLVKSDWTSEAIPFENSIDVETYFSLHGHKIRTEKPRTSQEKHIFNQLKALDWDVWSSVNWLRPDDDEMNIAEYDVIGICKYWLSVFECKKLNINRKLVALGKAEHSDLERVENDILNDLYKLSQAQKSFGGPFARTYWIFNGQANINRTNKERIKEFGITLIQGEEVNKLVSNAEKLGLPKKKVKK